jgi:hypothetical protein
MPLFILSALKWFSGFIVSIAAYLTTYFGKKVATVITAVGVLLTLTTAFWAAMKGLIETISVAAPAELNIAMGWLVPDNLAECFAAYMTAKIARFVYDYKSRGVQMRML